MISSSVFAVKDFYGRIIYEFESISRIVNVDQKLFLHIALRSRTQDSGLLVEEVRKPRLMTSCRYSNVAFSSVSIAFN